MNRPNFQIELAPYACHWQDSRGRLIDESESPIRSSYQRDRDRVIHSTAFRRLKHKTQVFVAHEGDHYRTRLTHSIEVAQIARTMARVLRLDEDLTEALALAHDLGHTPFGHAGERALNKAMAKFGGFDHNGQTLRIVTMLENKYGGFDGLNLTWECLEGLVKHNGPILTGDGQLTPRYKKRGIPVQISSYCDCHDLALDQYASIEAQLAAIADDIAYNAHDMDDGLRAGLFLIDDFADVPIAGDGLRAARQAYPDIADNRLVHETVRRLIANMVDDVIEQTKHQIAAANIATTQDVRQAGRSMVCFSPEMAAANDELQSFLNLRMYRHPKIATMTARAERIIHDLFEAYMNDESLIPEQWRLKEQISDDVIKSRQVCDFIAGMTDPFAIDRHHALFDLDPLFR